jgi:hypothetical protein
MAEDTPEGFGEPSSLATQLVAYSHEFDNRTEERHQMGQEKYGPIQFTSVDTLEAAIQEVLDLANYARYTYIKLRLLQESLETNKVANTPLPGKEQLGKDIGEKRYI